MNYYNYIDDLTPSESLRAKTYQAVENEIRQKNISVRKRKAACLSLAACFAIVATTILATNGIKKEPPLTNDNTKNPTLSAQTCAPDTKDESKKIRINSKSDGKKYGAQKIKLGDKVFVQYCSAAKENWGDDNGDIEIDESDIGDELCTLKAENLIDLDNWYDLKTMTSSQAEKCKFNKARVFEYKKCKNATRLLVKTKSDYYFFNLSDLENETSTADILDLYTSSGDNPIKKIKVIKNSADEEGYAVSRVITDTDTIASIITTITQCKDNYMFGEMSKRYKNDTDISTQYTLILVFDDSTTLEVGVSKKHLALSISQKNDYGYYALSDSGYNAIITSIEG